MKFTSFATLLSVSILLVQPALASLESAPTFGHGTLSHRAAKPTKCKSNNDCTKLGSTYTCGPSEFCAKPAQEGDACNEPAGCKTGFCNPQGKCATHSGKKDGAYCTTSASCAGFSCNDNKCQTRKKEGRKCDKNHDCVSFICERANGRCAETPSDSGDVNTTCLFSSDCDTGNCSYGYCLTKKDDGSECYKNNGCTSGVCTDDGVCSDGKDIAEGNKCQNSSQCKSGFCNKGRCDKPVEEGKKCSKNQGCKSGNCSDKKCAAKEDKN